MLQCFIKIMPSIRICALIVRIKFYGMNTCFCVLKRYKISGFLLEHFCHSFKLHIQQCGDFFCWLQVENELISYVHDGSEALLDSFIIFANSSELGKQSLPQTLFVTVESVNDEAPIITANKILQVSAPCFWIYHNNTGLPAWFPFVLFLMLIRYMTMYV